MKYISSKNILKSNLFVHIFVVNIIHNLKLWYSDWTVNVIIFYWKKKKINCVILPFAITFNTVYNATCYITVNTDMFGIQWHD